MKKLKLLTPILGIAAISGAVLPLVGCARKGSSEEKTVSGISCSPKSIDKKVGEKVTTNDVVVTLTYSDKSTKTGVYGEDFKVFAKNQSGVEEEITLPYTVPTLPAGTVLTSTIKAVKDSTKTATLTINVVADQKTLKEISVEQAATKKEFKVGEAFESTGLKIKLTYLDDTTEVVETGFTTNYDTTTFAATDLGPSKIVTVTYVKDGVTKTCAYKINVNNSNVHTFEDTAWTAINSAATAFENSTQDELAMRWLCKEFSDVAYIDTIAPEITDPNRMIEEHLGNFVGKTHKVTINTKDHEVRIIGINHDLIKGQAEKYGLFTFNTVNVLTGSSGYGLPSSYDSTNSYNYTGSVLRANLNNTGGGIKSLGSSVYSMLPVELQGIIKTVEKSICISHNSGATYDLVKYDDKLFPLTCTEMFKDGYSQAGVEGTTYKYWKDHNNDEDRVKKLVGGSNGVIYWLGSLTNNSIASALRIQAAGGITYGSITQSTQIDFAFCI